MSDRKHHHSDRPRRQMKTAVVVVVVGAGYVWHRRVLNATITALNELRDGEMADVLDKGIKYGIELCNLESYSDAARVKDYAFAAFDK